MFILQSTHQRIVEELMIDKLVLQQQVQRLEQETPAERKRRLALVSGMTDDEIAAVTEVASRNEEATIRPYEPAAWAREYARGVAASALRLAFQIKGKNR